MSCGSSSISDTSSWGIWAPSSLPNPPTGARAAAWQQWQHCLHPPDLLGDAQSALDSQMGSMGEKYTSRKAGTLDYPCHMEVERLKIIPSAVSWMGGGHLPAFATRRLVSPPAPEVGGSISCPGHSNPLTSEPVGSRRILSLGESHSAIVTPCPSPQALSSSTSLAVQ